MQVSGGFSFSGGFTFTPPSAVVSLFNGITNYSYTTNSYAGGAGTNYQSAYSVDGTKL